MDVIAHWAAPYYAQVAFGLSRFYLLNQCKFPIYFQNFSYIYATDGNVIYRENI